MNEKDLDIRKTSSSDKLNELLESKESSKMKKQKLNSERFEIAQLIYIRWKVKKLMNEKGLDQEKAMAKAKSKWTKLDEEKKLLYFKVSCIECHLLNEDGLCGKKLLDVEKRKEEKFVSFYFCKKWITSHSSTHFQNMTNLQ